ncbi:MAG: hypothetical protein JNM55_03445 [Anaerolineales bacterium]|nr:hypothetical protein [Anaerolineales bacterium]
MKLKSSNGSSFQLKIIGYEFPDIKDDYDDSNWLMIQIDVTSNENAWHANFPALTTFEVEELANWLSSIDSIKDDPGRRGFIELCLDFQFSTRTDGQQFLNVFCMNEMSPNGQPGNIFETKFPVSEINLSQAAKDLRLELQKFPQRVF